VDYEQRQEECEYYRHKTSELEEQLDQQTKLKQEAEEQKQVCVSLTFIATDRHYQPDVLFL